MISRQISLYLSIFIPFTIVGCAYLYMLASSHSFLRVDLLFMFFLHVLLYSAPFFYFRSSNRLSSRLWIIQGILTTLLWTWAAVLVLETAKQGTGVNIGAGWVILFGPVATALLSIMIHKLLSTKR